MTDDSQTMKSNESNNMVCMLKIEHGILTEVFEGSERTGTSVPVMSIGECLKSRSNVIDHLNTLITEGQNHAPTIEHFRAIVEEINSMGRERGLQPFSWDSNKMMFTGNNTNTQQLKHAFFYQEDSSDHNHS